MSFWKRSNIVSNSLKYYDYLVNNINCKYVWKCDKSHILNNYKNNMSNNHLEIGPGTGYFLKKFSCNNTKLTLMDINDNILNYSHGNLINNFKSINSINHNIFQKEFYGNYKSVGINYVLHCIPGRIEDNVQILIDNLQPKDCTIFGSSVITDTELVSILAKGELYFLNKFQIFNNKNDKSINLIRYLKNKNYNFNYEIIGNVMIFSINFKRIR
ncbi:hypothetical protein CPAV1605_414 [seawater metagenome]|uniref:Methyltransferase domain n=1 Tax=seawater metagenome TaxID=1561972 RepID=A0A5E8CJ91_9ZZZZ